MINKGLKDSLNKLREISTDIYTRYIPIITDDTNISDFATPMLEVPMVMNEFISNLVNKIVFSQFETKYFNNPLRILEGDRIPLGYAGEDVYVNPAVGRQFNVDDFVGLLQKYEADVKVQYLTVNTDLQYCVSIDRHKLKQAFTSWENLETFINNMTQSLYNGAYIDSYYLYKGLVSSAYASGNAVIEVVSNPNTEAQAKEFVTLAREYFLNMSLPSTNFNAWHKVGGSGRPITTWTERGDVVFLIRNDILAYLDVNVLASAFNMEKAELMGRIIPVDNFDVYNRETGTKVFDGSNILGLMGDKSWFKIKEQDMYLDEFYNANNRVWNYYLNMTIMVEYSLFANAVIFATAEPTPTPTESVVVSDNSVIVNIGESVNVNVTTKPSNKEVTISTNNENATATLNGDTLTITGVTQGNTTITLSSESVKTTIKVSVNTPTA